MRYHRIMDIGITLWQLLVLVLVILAIIFLVRHI